MWKDVNVRAFSLLEALVALLVISGGLLLFQSMSQLLAADLRYQTQQEQRDWLLFVDQLDNELSRSQFQKVENNKIYVHQDGKDIAFGKSNKDDFRKSNSAGQGYQPIIFRIKQATIRKDKDMITLSLVFEKGLERKVAYRVEENS